MKRILILLLPLLLVTAVVLGVFGLFQARFQREKLEDDLQRKARNVLETMTLPAQQILASGDRRTAQRLADTFQRRERSQGCAFYAASGKLLAVTPRIRDWNRLDGPSISAVIDSGQTREYRLLDAVTNPVYGIVAPVRDERDRIIGAVEVAYDTAYIEQSVTEVWKRVSVTMVALVTCIMLVLLFLQRTIFVLPVRRLTEWFRQFQRGETDAAVSIRGMDELRKLASEVEQVALSLRVARRSVAQKAQRRLERSELWTEEKLKDLVRARLGENALFLVSNREPYMHVKDEAAGKPRCVRPASGVVTALDPVMRACGGQWVAHGSGNADRQFVNSRGKLGVPPDDIHYILKRVWLSKAEEDGYYYGFSNEGLWPLCHITHTRPVFREQDWQLYRAVNQKFADAVVEELPARDPLVFIQDYHFTLLPKMIKERRPDATIALFWHIPWPNPEVFSVCPYQQEILEGMLGCDLIGFHVQFHCNNFLDTVNRVLEARIDTEKFSVVRANKETIVRAFPISVSDQQPAGEPADIAALRAEHGLEGKVVALSVERIDYTKGIVERIQAIDRFFEKYPSYKEQVVFVQMAAPSRTHIQRYHDLMAEIDAAVERVNWKHSEGSWKPVLYLKRHFSLDEIRPFYEMADLCIVSSLHDGMNLVAKEYIAARRDDSGVLMLSRFTGASRELVDAVQINPYSIEEFADAIRAAVEMPGDERARRMAAMRRSVAENNVYRWAGDIITELTGLKKP